MQLMSDKTKFIAFIELHKQKAEKIKVGNGRARAAMNDHGKSLKSETRREFCRCISETQLEAIHRELAQTEAAVAAQNLSPDEVQRMNHERETLTRNLDELRARTAEASQMAYDNEMQVTKSMDRFEQFLQDYTDLGHQIGIIGLSLEGMLLGTGNVNYVIELDLGLEDLNEVQTTGKRMRSTIWPALQTQGEELRKQTLDLENEKIAKDYKLDQLCQKVEEQKDAVGESEAKLKGLHDVAEDMKHVSCTSACRMSHAESLSSNCMPKQARRIVR